MTDEDDALLNELRGVFEEADPLPAAVSGVARAMLDWHDAACGHMMFGREPAAGAPAAADEPERR